MLANIPHLVAAHIVYILLPFVNNIITFLPAIIKRTVKYTSTNDDPKSIDDNLERYKNGIIPIMLAFMTLT